jgi:RNA polymerase sigma factor (sigma-70 family)
MKMARVSDWSVSDLSALYAQERSALAGVARRMLRSDLYAEEIVQEAFLKFMLAAPELDTPEQAIAYLRTTVNNLCLNHIRATGTRPNLVAIDADASQERINELSALEHVPFDATLAAAEDAAIIREALARLSQDQRTALVMWEMEGRSTEEIAETLGTTPANVRHVVSRARASFVRTLSTWIIDEESGTTALQALSTSYKKAAELAKKSSKVALSIVLLIAAVFGFTSFKNSIFGKSATTTQLVGNSALASTTTGNSAKKSNSAHFAGNSKSVTGLTGAKNSSGNNGVVSKSTTDGKSTALYQGWAAKVAALNFAGLDGNGVPFGFTVTDSQGHFGNLRLSTPTTTVGQRGVAIKSILTNSDDQGAYILLDQTISITGAGISYNFDPGAVSYKGNQYPLVVSAKSVQTTRLSDGSYLLTATIVANLDTAAGTIGESPVSQGVDLESAPSQIVTRIHLTSDQTKILGQAIDIVTAK